MSLLWIYSVTFCPLPYYGIDKPGIQLIDLIFLTVSDYFYQTTRLELNRYFTTSCCCQNVNFAHYIQLWNFTNVYPLNCWGFDIFYKGSIPIWYMDGCDSNECFIQHTLCIGTNLTYTIFPVFYIPTDIIIIRTHAIHS